MNESKKGFLIIIHILWKVVYATVVV